MNTSWPIRAISAITRAGQPGGSLAAPPFCPAPTWMPLLAECWISAMNGPRTCAGSAAERVVAWLVIADTSRFCSSAPTAAVPITRPTCRTVLSTPEAAPAIRGSMLRMATVTIGAKMQPMPTPATISGARNSYHAEVVVATAPAQPMPHREQRQAGHQDVLAADLVGQPARPPGR